MCSLVTSNAMYLIDSAMKQKALFSRSDSDLEAFSRYPTSVPSQHWSADQPL
jgi:hypothetical protein